MSPKKPNISQYMSISGGETLGKLFNKQNIFFFWDIISFLWTCITLITYSIIFKNFMLCCFHQIISGLTQEFRRTWFCWQDYEHHAPAQDSVSYQPVFLSLRWSGGKFKISNCLHFVEEITCTHKKYQEYEIFQLCYFKEPQYATFKYQKQTYSRRHSPGKEKRGPENGNFLYRQENILL